jgi:hypothetical protein
MFTVLSDDGQTPMPLTKPSVSSKFGMVSDTRLMSDRLARQTSG